MPSRRFVVSVTTASDGSYTGYTPVLSGRICAIHYIKTNFADTVDFAITAEATGETIWTESNVTASKSCMPRGATHTNAGVAQLYASGGTPVNDLIRLSRDRVKFVLAQGGNATTGAFHVVVED